MIEMTVFDLAAMATLLAAGVFLGRIWSSSRSAHHRIDSMEATFRAELRLFRADLKELTTRVIDLARNGGGAP